jgi:hypothetical protein
VYSRSGKWLLAIRSLKRALSLGEREGETHVSLVHLLHSLSLRERPHPCETVEKVIKEEMEKLNGKGLSARALAQRYAADVMGKGNLLERISAAIALHMVGEDGNEVVKLLSLDGLSPLNTPVRHGEQVPASRTIFFFLKKKKKKKKKRMKT